MVAELSRSEDEHEEENERIRLLPDMHPAPVGFVRWFDGSLYRKGWRDEHVEHLPTCSERCYVMRYLSPKGDPGTLMAVLLHDAVGHEDRAHKEAHLKLIQDREDERPAWLQTDHLRIDFKRHEVFVDGEAIALTPKEWKLIDLLGSNYGAVVKTDDLVVPIWGSEAITKVRANRKRNRESVGYHTLRQVLFRLRPKMGTDINRFIRPVLGGGYILEEAGSEVAYG